MTGFGQGAVNRVGAISVLIVELDGVVDVDRLPFGVHGVILIGARCPVLVCGNLGVIVFTILIRNEQSCGRRGFRLFVLNIANPALEFVAHTSLCGRNVYGLVDSDVVVLGNSSTIVVIPIDVGLDFFVLINEHSLELNGVVILSFRIEIRSRYRISGLTVCNLCVTHQHIKSIARIDIYSRILVCSSIPLLNSPMAEDIIICVLGRRSTLCNSLSLVDIRVRIRDSTCTIVGDIILNLDAIRTNQLAAPFGVKINFSDSARIPWIDFAGTKKPSVLLNHRLVEHEGVKVKRLFLHLFICKPANQVVVDSLATNIAKLVSVVSIEVF